MESLGEKPPAPTEEGNAESEKEAFGEAYLRGVASGDRPFDVKAGDTSVKVSDYTQAVLGHLSRLLKKEKKEIITLAVCHFGRSLTATPLTSLNDLGVQTQGLQLSIQNLVLEVMEFDQLAVSVANQEASASPPDRG
ncbi:MAG: hypothetical protein Q7T82_11165 [Armatimonadota bacterium]|nr:hypothetical protein [Armatimonadota bacterium]